MHAHPPARRRRLTNSRGRTISLYNYASLRGDADGEYKNCRSIACPHQALILARPCGPRSALAPRGKESPRKKEKKREKRWIVHGVTALIHMASVLCVAPTHLLCVWGRVRVRLCSKCVLVCGYTGLGTGRAPSSGLGISRGGTRALRATSSGAAVGL